MTYLYEFLPYQEGPETVHPAYEVVFGPIAGSGQAEEQKIAMDAFFIELREWRQTQLDYIRTLSHFELFHWKLAYLSNLKAALPSEQQLWRFPDDGWQPDVEGNPPSIP